MSNEPIAIVGSGCRLPGGATTPSKLWDILKQPPDLRREIPDDRFNVDRYYHPDNSHHGTSNIRHSYVLDDDFRSFDANFFGVKAAEAASMDPQQRLLLETVYESLESAGIPMEAIRGSHTGVFVGNMSVDYTEILSQDIDSCPTYFAPGTARSILSNRISYFFDWRGPSISIDTACSSSLVAVHQAIQSLRSGEVPLAVAAGANLLLAPSQYIAESKLKMLSPTGRSKMWDESADGYARGEGFSSVVLKTLSAALRDGNHIECIIRETGSNHDGRTKGITMPSPIAQAALIRDTYRRAGLDLSISSDRPQYFEAHGTGTPAGDPVEAEAISTAFYGPESGFKRTLGSAKLLVGSIKTVIGHTEGTAGLASLMKVSLALQKGQVPPNLHLNRLSPTVRPHYSNLEIPTTLRDWPVVERDSVRRASVNSFGFGGANAHAILEAYTPQKATTGPSTTPSSPFAPYIFSSASDSALAAIIAAHADYIEANPEVDLHDVCYTLYNHRSTLQKRAVFPALPRNGLLERLRAYGRSDNMVDPSTVRSLPSKPRVLGIFTGQGAQWPRMGAELIENSVAVREILEELEESLANLPLPDRPSWSLKDELLAAADKSQIHKAERSQPLCTALQIILVNVLRYAGVTFDAVVGHSSGEIAVAYAAGVITSSEAIRIAYYRGFHTHKSQGPNGQPGSMMAVGTSFEDAQELCNLDDFKGRLRVAAVNSPSSVTLSGDADAIEQAGIVLEEEDKFHRTLQVDTAYHSHHMDPCLVPYTESLQACNISPKPSNNAACTWISSVHACDISDATGDLGSAYWASNMGQPVLFSQACEVALREQGPFDQIIEIGPHPALKGPTNQTIESTIRESIPYAGTCRRKQNAIESLSKCVGDLWATNGKMAVDFGRYESFVSGSKERRLLKDLPTYQWDHETPHSHDSRIIKAMRIASMRSNELLGTRIIDNSLSEARWRNRLLSSEVSWLKHHEVQNQVVYPAAGYVACAIEAVRDFLAEESISVVEVQDFVVGQALLIPDRVGVETTTSLTSIIRNTHTLTARFSFLAEDPRSSFAKLSERASANLIISLGEPNPDALPRQSIPNFQMLDVDEDRFYDALHGLGFGYTGPFRALKGLRRKMDVAEGVISCPEKTHGFDQLPVHPAALDAAIQSIMLAYCFPGDTRLRTIHLPTGIDKIRFNLHLCESSSVTDTRFRSTVPSGGVELSDINGDVDVYSQDGTALVQVQGLHTKPLLPPRPDSDLHLFTEFTYAPRIPQGRCLAPQDQEAVSEKELFIDIERVAYFYLKRLDKTVPPHKRRDLPAHQVSLFNYIDNVSDRINRKTLPHVSSEWANDTHDDILQVVARRPGSIDLELMHAVGENLPSVIRGEMNMLEPMMEDDKLNRFYVDALGMPRYLEQLSHTVAQLSHRYPHMHILEVGAGTGGATKLLLKHLDGGFNSYTYTDISSGFFPKAQEVFQDTHKMRFKTLDIERDILEQGYREHTFDVVIANLVIHATKNLESTLWNLRRLIKPGGYLIVLEITDNDQLRFGFLFGGLPGWWLSQEDDRKLSPCISIEQWDTLMRAQGFSGADAVTPHVPTCPLSVILTQAVDDRVALLRQPLNAAPSQADFGDLTIIGAESDRASKVVEEITTIVGPYFKSTRLIPNFDELLTQELPLMGTVISLAELYSPIFKQITAERFRALQNIFKQSRNVMWVTVGATAENPHSSMILGIGRNLVLEMSHLRLQMVDFDALASVTSDLVAENLLSFEFMGMWEQSGKSHDLLWSTEPELYYQNGCLHIPRLKLSKNRNLRYNSARRLITRDVDSKITPVTLTVDDSGSYSLGQPSSRFAAKTRSNVVRIQVDTSILWSVKLPSSDFLFIISGKDDNGKTRVALSDSQSSFIDVDKSWTIPITTSESVDQILLALYDTIVAQTLLHGVESGQCLAVLGAASSLAGALQGAGSRRGIKVLILTSSRVPVTGTIFVHAKEPVRSLKSKLRGAHLQINRFANMGDHEDTAQAVISCLDTHCNVMDLRSLIRASPFVTERTFLGLDCDVPSILRAAWANVMSDKRTIDARGVSRFSPTDLTSTDIPPVGQLSLVDWTGSSLLPTRLQPPFSTITFSPDKTYWLVGLTGSLGLSLCSWMINRGARHLVVTSRNPNIDPGWLSDAESRGAIVKAFSNDITNREAVISAYKTIEATMPPIGGVAQGAMVLNDGMFAEMTMSTMEKVVKPKVDGSIYLEEIFHDAPLDFFVYFSSVAAITGNVGQSVYAAANMFMSALAAGRRKRGVAGSVIHIGAIMGNGYITRELNQKQQKFLEEVGNVWLSEQDFLNIFAEGVLASKPGSGETWETTTGLRLLSQDEKVSWASDPKFQHLVRYYGESNLAGLQKSSGLPLKTQLEGAKTEDEVSTLLDDAFALKIRSILQISEERDVLDTKLDELGMDSLVAVDIRSWFLKELSVDVPVLEILNGVSARSLIRGVQDVVISSMALSIDLKDTMEASRPPELETVKLERTQTTTDTSSDRLESSDGMESSELNPDPSASDSLDIPDTSPSEHTADEPESNEIEIGHLKHDIERSIPLSFGQSRFWFLKHFLPNQSAFNITTVIQMRGKLDIERLANSVTAVATHHEALRTAFVSNGNQPMQVVLKKPRLNLECKTIVNDDDVTDAYEAIKRHVYELEKGKLMRIQLLIRSPTTHFLILGYHHINMDGLSFEVFFNDIQKHFEGKAFTPDVIQYPDFTIREHHEHKLRMWGPELSFWRTTFAKLPEPLPLLPLSSKTCRPSSIEYGTTRVERRIPAQLSDLIKRTARKFKSGAFAFYLALLKVLVLRYVDVDELCIGIADANRRQSEVLESVGLYLNLVPVLVACDLSQPFSESLEDMQKRSQEALANARVPFDILLNELGVARSASHTPLFQVFMNYRQGVREVREFCGCECEGELLGGGELAYDLSFDIVENPGGETNVMLSVQKALYDETSARILLDAFFNLMEAFARNPAARSNKPALYSQLAIQAALDMGSGPSTEPTWPATISHRVDDVIKAHPDKLALTDGDRMHMTYGEMGFLTERIQLALGNSSSRGRTIGVMGRPTPAMVCSILAIMRCGKILVPLDPRATLARLSAITAESQLSCVLVDESTQADAMQLPGDVAVINVSNLPRSQEVAPDNTSQPTDQAVLMYTSGSTGTPKGICLSHSSLLNNLEVATRQFRLKEDVEVVLQQSSFSFDMSLFQIVVGLCNIGVVVVVPDNVRGDFRALAAIMLKTGVTFTMATPSEYSFLIRYGSPELKQNGKWRMACSSGEKVTRSLIESFRSLGKNELTFVDCYGPAETTFGCSSIILPYHENTTQNTIPQQVWPNYAIYILGEEDGKPVPAGVPGEIYVAGGGVGLGYFNNATLTSQKFLPNPYANRAFRSCGWTTMYRTGDRGRLSTSGGLILEGRIGGDAQVKLRGIRLDLEEIESSIVKESQGSIIQAAVSMRTDESSNTDYLVAHVVMDKPNTGSEGPVGLAHLQQSLSLSNTMRPSIMVPVLSLPLNASNKLDRRALGSLPVAMPTAKAGTGMDHELSSTQRKVKELWELVIPAEVIAGRDIDARTDFFHVGGTSLLLVELQALLREKLAYTPSVQQLFQSSTLQAMALLVEGGASSGADAPVIDWEAESDLLSSEAYENSDQIDGADQLPGFTAEEQDGPLRTVVLTGATGFLGRHILEHLLESPSIQKIYCIAVRQDLAALRATKSFADPRVEVLSGNLQAEDLGLSPSDARHVFGAADRIIHNAADVSFMKTYASLRRTNVAGTKKVAALALRYGPRRRALPHLHFVSSASVTQLTPLDEVGEISLAAYPPPSSSTQSEVVDGYTAAKWVSERHLEKLAAAHEGRLHITIHRPSSITGNDDSEVDLMGNVFRFVEALEAVPEGQSWKGNFDLISVHSVAAAIVKAVVDPDNGTRGENPAVRYQYEAGEIVYPLSTMKDMMAAGGDFPVRMLDLKEWVDRAEEKGLNAMLAAYLRSASDRNVRLAFPRLITRIR